MSFRRVAPALGAIALAVTTIAAAAVAVVASASPAAAATTSGSGGAGLLALRNGDLDATTPSRYGVVVMNAWEAGRIPALKAANPGIEVLVYKDMSSTRSYAVRNGVDDALLPTGVGYAYAQAVHPEWFLTNETGQRVEWVGYDDHWWMDVGNPSYIDAWATNVAAELAAKGWDGVMIDNAITDPDVYLPGDWELATYPTDASYQVATERFLAAVGPRLRGAGFQVVPNMGGNAPSMDLYRRWTGLAGGGLREYFGRWGSDGTQPLFTGWGWDHQLAQQEAAQAAGMYLAVAYGDPSDVRYMRYARASFLMGWDGGASALLYTPPAAARDPWSPEWTVDVGLPAAARTAVGGAWLRRYTGGVVVVNPSTAAVTVPLGGAFVTPEGTTVMSVTLASATGLVLPNAAGTPSLPPAPAPAPAAPAPATASTPAPAPAPAPVAVSTPAPPVPAPAPIPSTPSPANDGYWVLGADGGVFAYGGAQFHGSLPGLGVRNRAVTLASTPSGSGYWLLGADGGIFAFGDAGFHGSVPGLRLRGNVTAIDLQPTPSGNGYWILGADGGIFTFGDAGFHGSVPGLGVRNRAVKIAPTPSGNGYWILGEDGGVFSFGDARFHGSLPGLGTRNRSISLAATPSGNGYWVLGADGGIFAFGDAGFHGSVPGLGVNEVGVQLRPTPSGRGYYVLSARGEVFAFGDAPKLGSPAALGVRGQDLAVL